MFFANFVAGSDEPVPVFILIGYTWAELLHELPDVVYNGVDLF